MEQTTEKSGLPALEEITQQSTMKIVILPISKFSRSVYETTIFKTAPSGIRSPVQAFVHEVDDPHVNDFLPSKIWYDEELGLVGLFYINETLPKAARPFKGKMYIMYAYITGDTLDYDMNVRVLIDQVKMPMGMVHVFVFGEEQATSLLTKKIEEKN